MAVAAIATFQARGGTYTWLASPANGNWDTSSLNWSDGTTDGVAWVDDASAPNDAVFGTTSTKSVKGDYALARFTSGGDLLAGWTVTLNGQAVGSAIASGMKVEVQKDATGLWLDVREPGIRFIIR